MKDSVIRYRLHLTGEGRRAETVRKGVVCGKKPSEKAGQIRIVDEAGKFRQIIYQYGIFKYTLGVFFLAYRQIGSPFQKIYISSLATAERRSKIRTFFKRIHHIEYTIKPTEKTIVTVRKF